MTYTKPEPGKPIIIEAAGQLLEIRFPLREMKAMDNETGVNLLKGGVEIQDPAKLAIVLYYGLRANNPNITPEWIEEHFDASMLTGLYPVLLYAATGKWIDFDQTIDKALRDRGLQPAIPNDAGPQNMTGSLSGQSDGMTSDVVKQNSGT